MNMNPKNIEDIYPLTIIKMRYGGKIVIFNCESDSEMVGDVQMDEEPYHRLEEWMEENVAPCKYGIGNTVYEAFTDYQIRNKK